MKHSPPAWIRRAAEMPPVGPNTKFLLAQPFLAATAVALERRGGAGIAAPFGLGIEGTTQWFEAAARSFGIAPGHIGDVLAAPAARAKTTTSTTSSSLPQCFTIFGTIRNGDPYLRSSLRAYERADRFGFST